MRQLLDINNNFDKFDTNNFNLYVKQSTRDLIIKKSQR